MYYNDINAPVAQLDRVSDSDSEGRWFESSRAYQYQSLICPVDKSGFLKINIKNDSHKRVVFGGDNRDRTDDLLHAMQALSQPTQNYTPVTKD